MKIYILQKREERDFFNVGVVDDIEDAKAWVEQAWTLGYRRYESFDLDRKSNHDTAG